MSGFGQIVSGPAEEITLDYLVVFLDRLGLEVPKPVAHIFHPGDKVAIGMFLKVYKWYALDLPA